MNPFAYSSDNKRYHTLAYHNRSMGRKLYKASLNAGFTCPNLDGSRGTGGCVFCDSGSRCFAPEKSLTIPEQLKQEAGRIHKKTPGAGLTAYFQANSNTYGPVSVLAPLVEQALGFPGVAALSLATRPDCLKVDMLDYLARTAAKIPLTVELGLQTAHDRTARRINRCYAYAEFLEGFAALRSRGIRICVHLINGLPGEAPAQMCETAQKLGALAPEGVKIHLLHVLRDTPLAQLYRYGDYMPMTQELYVNTVVSQLELLPPETVIERLTGDGDAARLLAPMWSRDKICVLGAIDKRMKQRDTWQGRLSLAKSRVLVYNDVNKLDMEKKLEG